MVGSYRLQDGRIIFDFSSGADASGTLNGEVLEIRYSDRMVHCRIVRRKSHVAPVSLVSWLRTQARRVAQGWIAGTMKPAA